MKRNAPKAWILWPVFLLLLLGACSKEKKTRYSSVPIIGYPFPFGVNVKSLIGRSHWKVTSSECAIPYDSYHVSGSQWSDYSEVVLTADSLGALQAFSARRPFTNDAALQSYLRDVSEEIWRRYGAQSDSTKEKKKILGRLWRDKAGNFLSVYVENGGVRVNAASGRIEHDCPSFLDERLPPPIH